MPITQDRMLAMIKEGDMLDAAVKRIRDSLKMIIKCQAEELEGFTTADELVAHLDMVLTNNPQPRIEALIAEKVHFAKVGKNNAKVRNYMEAKRREAGVPQAYGPRSKARQEPEVAPWTPSPEYAERLTKASPPAVVASVPAQQAIDYATMPRFSPEDLLKPKGERIGVIVEVEGGFPEISPDTDPTTLL